MRHKLALASGKVEGKTAYLLAKSEEPEQRFEVDSFQLFNSDSFRRGGELVGHSHVSLFQNIRLSAEI